MGHLINPTAFRIGWFSNWKDSWYSDFVYYPEFLHDIFRIRLYLNYLFTRTFFDRKGLLFSHFEIYFKYNYLLTKLFYYDSSLMAGIFAFDLEFTNYHFKRSFYHLRKRRSHFEHSRYVTLFLGIFYSLFAYIELFRDVYLKTLQFQERSHSRFFQYGTPEKPVFGKPLDTHRARLSQQRKASFKKPRRQLEKFLVSTEDDDVQLRERFRFKPSVDYFEYADAVPRVDYKWRSKRRSYAKDNYKLVSPSENITMHVDDIDYYNRRYPTWPFYLKRGWVSLFRRVINRLGKKYYFFNAPWYRRKFRRFLQYHTIRKLFFYAGPGNFDKLLSVFFFSKNYSNSPFKYEFKVLLVLFFLFKHAWQFLRRDDGPVSDKKDDFIRMMFLNTSSLFFFRRLKFDFLRNFLTSIIKFLVPHLTVKTSIFLISNDTVTARFLSTFIAKRLVQGYAIKQVLSPILKDLYNVAVTTRVSRRFFALRVSGLRGKIEYRKAIIRNFIIKYIMCYKRLFAKVFALNKTWLNFYSLVFLNFFFKKLLARRRRSRYKKALRLVVGLSKSFMLRRASFLFFFSYDFSVISSNLHYAFNEIFTDWAYQQMQGNSIFYFYIIDDLFSNFSILFYTKVFKINLLHSFVAASGFFNRLIRFSYSKYNYNWVIAFNKLSKLHMRLKHRRTFERECVFGYKVHLRGRFSRKQRASSVWFTKGLVPLNTLSAPIDYSFYAVPLRNSLVSIKVWFYRDNFYPKWYLRQS